MKFKMVLLLSFFSLLTSACTTNTMVMHDEVFELNQPERIIKHDFSSKFSQVILNEPKSNDLNK